MPDPEISIVIVSWNVRELLINCLRSIEQHVTTPHEVVVVDNHSSDGTVEALQQQFPETTVIVNNQNAGFAHANNQGWQKTHGQYICFLNPDTLLLNNPFPILIKAAQQPQVGCVGPQLLNADRSLQQSVRGFPSLADQTLVLLKMRWLWRWLSPLRRYMAPTLPPGQQRVDQIMGAAMVVPRSVLLDGGSFDEGYWIWFEEVDLCQRLHRKGLMVLYEPAAQLIHFGGSSFSQHISVAKQVWFMRSLGRYASKYWSPYSRVWMYLLMPVSYLLTMIQSLFKPR